MKPRGQSKEIRMLRAGLTPPGEVTLAGVVAISFARRPGEASSEGTSVSEETLVGRDSRS